MWKDLKNFLFRGNVVDLAVAVVIGGAFGKIVSSFVQDIILPFVGLFTGNVNLTDLFFVLSDKSIHTLDEAKAAGVSVIKYGVFINNIVDFFIIGTVVFFIVRAVNKAIPKEEDTPKPAMKDCPRCFSAIPEKASKCPNCTADI